MPEDLRPGTMADLQSGTLSPEGQAWVQQQLGFGAGSAQARDVLAAHGIPYYEWEQLALAPDLRPYVTALEPNPIFGGVKTPIGVRPGIPPIYDPALNPQTLSALGEGGAWGRVQTYFDWVAARSAAGELAFTPSEIGGAQRVTFLGGQPLFMPVGGAPVSVFQPPPEPEVSPQALQQYLAWVSTRAAPPAGLMNTLQVGAAGGAQPAPAPGAAAEIGHRLGALAAQVRTQGARVTGLRLGPNTGFLEIHLDTTDHLYPVLETTAHGLVGASRDFGIGLSITIDADPGLYGTLGGVEKLERMVQSLSLPAQLRLVIRAGDGRLLFASTPDGP
jgi:hypothetical protein